MSPMYALQNGHFSPEHESHYITAYNMFKDKYIIGHGPKSFRYLCKKNVYRFDKASCSTHPHNTYFQLLAETGILGFLIIAYLFIYLIKILIDNLIHKLRHKIYKIHNSKIYITCGLIMYLWPITPHGNFFNNWLSGLLFFQIAIFLFLENYKEKHK